MAPEEKPRIGGAGLQDKLNATKTSSRMMARKKHQSREVAQATGGCVVEHWAGSRTQHTPVGAEACSRSVRANPGAQCLPSVSRKKLKLLNQRVY